MVARRWGIFVLAGSLWLAHAGASQKAKDFGETIITSDHLEILDDEGGTRFLFRDQVSIESTNLHASCTAMEIITRPRQDSGPASGRDVAPLGEVASIRLTGRVVLTQEGRRAECDEALVLPAQDKIILTGNPRVIYPDGTVSGFRIEIIKGERRVRVFGDPDGSGGRTRTTLPALPDLGFSDR